MLDAVARKLMSIRGGYDLIAGEASSDDLANNIPENEEIVRRRVPS